jgi:prepilin signal peptidase PulO-like enzyme (type II secretory pathway)
MLIVSALAGWLAGGLGNLAADALPCLGDRDAANLPASSEAQGLQRLLPDGRLRSDEETSPHSDPAVEPRARRGSLALWHYLTLPWYPFRHGLCPHCQARRPWRAPALEAALIAIFALAWFRAHSNPALLLILSAYSTFLLVVLVIDLEHRRVLNVMLGPAVVIALVASLAPGLPGPRSALLGGAVGLGAFLVLAFIGRGALGGGDVKLAGVIGVMTGYPGVVAALALGVVLGGAAALTLLITRQATRKSYMAYAPYLAVGALIILYSTLSR